MTIASQEFRKTPQDWTEIRQTLQRLGLIIDTIVTEVNALSTTMGATFAFQTILTPSGLPDSPVADSTMDTLTLLNGAGISITSTAAVPDTITVASTITQYTHPNTAVTPGSYTNTNLTVDAQGHITAAASGASGGYSLFTETGPTRNETATSGDIIILCDCTANAITVNLPTAVGNTARFTIKKTDSSANAVTVDGSGGQTIDGSLTALLRVPNVSITIVNNNANWFVI